MALTDDLERLNSGYMKNFDPVRYELILSLSKRLLKPENIANAQITEKLRSILNQYLADFVPAHQQAKLTLEMMSFRYPEHLKTAQLLFDQCRFKQITRFYVRLGQVKDSLDVLEDLRELNNDLNLQSEIESQIEAPANVDDLLSQQSKKSGLHQNESPINEPSGTGEQLELKSVKYHKESLMHFDIDKIISRAIAEGPENPGPLNPQMLAIKSLAQMRNLSPQYVRRFTGYLETLLWLEKGAPPPTR